MAASSEDLEFAEFKPAPQGDCKYKDYQKAFVVTTPGVSVTSSQGDGAGATLSELTFIFKVGKADAASFAKLTRDNDQKITSVKYTSTQVYNGKREKKVDVEYSGLTLKHCVDQAIRGENKSMLTLTVQYKKAKGKEYQYTTDGKVEKTFDVDVDLEEGKY